MGSAPPSGERSVLDASILVVDDLETNRMMISALLARHGFTQVKCVDGGEAALAALSSQRVDCLLLDLVMPGIGGLEVCRRVRSNPALAGLPILIQTAMTARDEVLAAFDAGATDVIHKPFDPRELVSRVSVHTANALMSRAMRLDNTRMVNELAEAALLMTSVLPRTETLKAIRTAAGIAFDWFSRPCSAVGGDLWQAWLLGGGKVALFFGDVSGHGIGAALRAFSTHSVLSPLPSFADDPLKMAALLDCRLVSVDRDHHHFVAGVYGVFDRVEGCFSYVAAGLRNAVLLRADGRREALKLSGLPFGLTEDAGRQLGRVAIGKGDRLLIYSDALVEQAAEGSMTETALAGWIEEQVARAGETGEAEVARHLGKTFLASNPDCADDLLLVSATFPDYPVLVNGRPLHPFTGPAELLPGHGASLLVVDDMPMNRKLLDTMLKAEGYAIAEAEDGLVALERLQAEPERFDAILLDRQMPRMDGMTLLRHLKSDIRLAQIPVIMQTAFGSSEDIAEGIQAGVFYYLVKPLQLQILSSVVKAAVADHRRAQKLRTDLRRQSGTLALLEQGEFAFRTLAEADWLAVALASLCPWAPDVVTGLSELMVNAIEHGNLEISYQEKTEFLTSGRLIEEIEARLARPDLGDRRASIAVSREPQGLRFTVRDQGPGFDWRPYMDISPERAFHSHGRGIAIARRLSFDTLAYHEPGNVVEVAVAMPS
ncbi:Serine phosphatase RsbU regulator of sigma subunit [Paramagnetospirillum magnetotacticum MS-1]|uniref:Serine phosphatase RsbU regulator of sigma subunit n=1 Tax=Paramagnetospirillum magnetotacticum MS-1 TaxID=272627 RepID=A0A0C2YV40_PARME|nr:response regulator [Paramagnetospirillum magnetotacticum]KIL98565.1 Serine phosphatase RsbU regulator of sigma subunit [Paramagnetospirillum magnetotacticum MS-1]